MQPIINESGHCGTPDKPLYLVQLGKEWNKEKSEIVRQRLQAGLPNHNVLVLFGEDVHEPVYKLYTPSSGEPLATMCPLKLKTILSEA